MRWAACVLLSWCGVTSALAQTSDPCTTQSNTIEINECLTQRLKDRDKTLNAEYQSLLRRLKPSDTFDQIDYPRARRHLIDSQRAWITFRDNDCQGRFVLYELGTIRAAVALTCQIEHTERRTRDLRAWMLAQ